MKRALAIRQTGKQPALIDVRSGQVDHDARRQPDSRTGDGQASRSVGYGLRFVACHCAICAGISEQNERWAVRMIKISTCYCDSGRGTDCVAYLNSRLSLSSSSSDPAVTPTCWWWRVRPIKGLESPNSNISAMRGGKRIAIISSCISPGKLE